MWRWAWGVIIGAAILGGCGVEEQEIRLGCPGGETDTSFNLSNTSDSTWSGVQISVRAMRPDGVEEECDQRHFATWSPGDVKSIPKCPGEKLLITIEVGSQQAFFVLADGVLYRKLGRREIRVS